MKKYILTVCMLVQTLAMLAVDVTVNDVYYTLHDTDGGYATVSGYYTAESDDLNIPTSITYSGKQYPVWGIGDNAFTSTGIKSIILPESLKTIGTYAFSGCAKLKQIELPSSLRIINDGAFQRSGLSSIVLPEGLETLGGEVFIGTAITEITLPSTLKTLGARAFKSMRIASIILPDGLETIGEEAFANCSQLSGISIPGSVRSIGASAFAGSVVKDVTLSEGIREIGNKAFTNCTKLTDISIPGSVHSIGAQTFAGSIVKNVTLSEGIQEIGNQAFANCTELTGISIPGSVRSIGAQTFAGSVVKNVTLSEGIQEIGDEAFANCTKLTNIALPSTLIVMGEGMFANSVLKTITFPEGIQEVAPKMFAGCKRLTDISLPSSVRQIGECAFLQSSITTITIPEGLETIGKSAFESCENLSSMYIPSAVEKIEDRAFKKCGIADVTLSDGLQEIGVSAFFGCENLTSIHIPGSVKEVGDFAFRWSGLKDVTLEEGIEKLGYYSFSLLLNGTSIHIPASVRCMTAAFAPASRYIYRSGLGEVQCPEEDREDEFNYYFKLTGDKSKDDVFIFTGKEADKCYLTSLTVNGDNPNFKVVDGVVYSRDMERIIYFPRFYSKDIYEMPPTVKSVALAALCGIRTKAFFISPNMTTDGFNCHLPEINDFSVFPESMDGLKSCSAVGYNKGNYGFHKIILANYLDVDSFGGFYFDYGYGFPNGLCIPPHLRYFYLNQENPHDIHAVYAHTIYNVNLDYDRPPHGYYTDKLNKLTMGFSNLINYEIISQNNNKVLLEYPITVERIESLELDGVPLQKIGDNTYRIEDLREDSKYGFKATVKFKDCSYTYSVLCPVTTEKFSGIDEISSEQDCEGEVEYYNLQGQRVERPASGTIVIRRSGGKAEKVIIK